MYYLARWNFVDLYHKNHEKALGGDANTARWRKA